MDIVLGVSMTPTTVRMALVEGDKADGAIVDHDTFETSSEAGSATPVEQVVSAVLGTREGAEEGGHKLASVGVAWSDHDAAAQLRDALAAAGVKDVMLVSELHAAASLAQAAGRSVGYDSTGLLFLDKDTATLSVVQSSDGSISKVLSRSLHCTDAMDVLTEMASAVAAQDAPPQGMFVIGSGVDVAAVKNHLADLVDIPVNAPGDADLALARGAALASAGAPTFDAATAGLAYSMAPAGAGAGAGALMAADEFGFDDLGDVPVVSQGRKPFLLVGSALTSIFVVGVVALAISLAVSIKPTGEQRPAPPQAAVAPSIRAEAPVAPPAAAPPAAPAPAPVAAPPVVETMQAPAPVVVQRHVEESAPIVHAPAPEPEAPAPAPAPVAAPIPVALPAPAPAPEAPAPLIPALLPPAQVPVAAAPAPAPQTPPWMRGRYPGGYGPGGPGGYPGGYGPGGYPGGGYPGGYPQGGPDGQYQDPYGQYPQYPTQPKHKTTCVFFICSRS